MFLFLFRRKSYLSIRVYITPSSPSNKYTVKFNYQIYDDTTCSYIIIICIFCINGIKVYTFYACLVFRPYKIAVIHGDSSSDIIKLLLTIYTNERTRYNFTMLNENINCILYNIVMRVQVYTFIVYII